MEKRIFKETQNASDEETLLGFENMGDDVFQIIFSFLNAHELSLVDVCSSTTRILSGKAWDRLSREITATSYSRVDLQDFFTPKQQSILFYRAMRLAERMELQNQCRLDIVEKSDVNGICPECGMLPDIEIQAFQKTESILFFARLSSGVTKTNSSPANVIWQGFVSPHKQHTWGESTILFFHLKEFSSTMNWAPVMKELLNYEHIGHDSVNSPQFQSLVQKAFGNLALTVVAFRREHFQPVPILSSSGINSVSRDNRLFFRIESRHCRSRSTGREAWLYPTLVANIAMSAETPGELLGVRLVCEGVV
jgi:hypothetical protein